MSHQTQSPTPPPGPKHAALYARVSTEEQTKNYSIAAQVELLRLKAQAEGYVLTSEHEYIDDGYSGTTADRPALQRLLADAQAGQFHVVLVYRLDRFYRSTRQLLNTVHTLSGWGVSLVSATEPFDTGSPTGRFMLSLLASVAELERDTFMERSQLGRLKKTRAGRFAGGALPTGYKAIPKTGEIVVDEAAAEPIRLAFQWYAGGDTST